LRRPAPFRVAGHAVGVSSTPELTEDGSSIRRGTGASTRHGATSTAGHDGTKPRKAGTGRPTPQSAGSTAGGGVKRVVGEGGEWEETKKIQRGRIKTYSAASPEGGGIVNGVLREGG